MRETIYDELDEAVKRGVTPKRRYVRQVLLVAEELLKKRQVRELIVQDLSHYVGKVISLKKSSFESRPFHEEASLFQLARNRLSNDLKPTPSRSPKKNV